MSIVIIKDGDAVTTTLAIAEGTFNDHASVIKLVRAYQADLEDFGLVRFEIQPRLPGQHGGGDTEFAILNEPQSTLLLTFMRNTDIVRAFKKKLVREFWEMVQQRNQGAAALPTDYIGALEHLLASKRAEQLAIEQRDHAIETKAEIGSRREATAMATASAAVREARQLKEQLGLGVTQATIVAVEKALDHEFGVSGWRPLKKWCEARGIKSPRVNHPTFGWVIAWPAGAWMDVYQVDLADLFGADGEHA